jgi:hypothetical protein
MRGVFAHRRMRRDVETYLDGELASDAGVRVAGHLSKCWGCSALAETHRLLRRSLQHHRDAKPQTVVERRLRRFAENLAAGRSPP